MNRSQLIQNYLLDIFNFLRFEIISNGVKDFIRSGLNDAFNIPYENVIFTEHENTLETNVRFYDTDGTPKIITASIINNIVSVKFNKIDSFKYFN